MLTLAQLRRHAQRNRIGLQVQEREYIQCVFLYLLYTARRAQPNGLHFKGGTALRIVYGSPRFSEDLDFNSDLPSAETLGLLRATVAELSMFGIEGIVRNERAHAQGLGFDLSYQGPMYDGRSGTKGKVRVDVSLRREPVQVARPLVQSQYDDVESFIINVLTLEQIFAEKVRALMVRGKARDVYDLWFLANKGVRADRGLLNQKLALYNMSFEPKGLDKALRMAQADWTRDLEPLLAVTPDFAQVRTVVLAAFR